MASSTTPVDLLNPGQVFACLGILEMADTLLGDGVAAFDWTSEHETRFNLRTQGTEPPVDRVMRFLENAQVVARAPAESNTVKKWKPSWGDRPEFEPLGSPFPFPEPNMPATLPVVLRDDSAVEIPLDYWGDATKRDNVKFWAGSRGYPGAAIASNALESVRGKMRQHGSNPFALSAPQSSSFRFDWRRDYIPVQDGFSPNRHGNIRMVGYPLVEILAAIGMTHARPRRRNKFNKLEYEYGVLGFDNGLLLDPVFHRAALGAISTPIPGSIFRRFIMNLDWPDREGQARCITKVSELEVTQS